MAVVLVCVGATASFVESIRLKWHERAFSDALGNLASLHELPLCDHSPPVVEGKILVLDSSGKLSPLHLQLPSRLRAFSLNEVGTVVFADYRKDKVGVYQGGGEAYVNVCALRVVNVRLRRTLAIQDIRGTDPPSAKPWSGSEESGSSPDYYAIRFIRQIPQDKALQKQKHIVPQEWGYYLLVVILAALGAIGLKTNRNWRSRSDYRESRLWIGSTAIATGLAASAFIGHDPWVTYWFAATPGILVLMFRERIPSVICSALSKNDNAWAVSLFTIVGAFVGPQMLVLSVVPYLCAIGVLAILCRKLPSSVTYHRDTIVERLLDAVRSDASLLVLGCIIVAWIANQWL